MRPIGVKRHGVDVGAFVPREHGRRPVTATDDARRHQLPNVRERPTRLRKAEPTAVAECDPLLCRRRCPDHPAHDARITRLRVERRRSGGLRQSSVAKPHARDKQRRHEGRSRPCLVRPVAHRASPVDCGHSSRSRRGKPAVQFVLPGRLPRQSVRRSGRGGTMKRIHLWLPIVACATVGACSDEPTPVAEEPGAAAPASPAAAAATERIVYSSLRPGNWDIFYFASGGAAPRRLTDHPGLDYDAALSPDGRWVVFTSERRGNPDLYALELEGGARAAPADRQPRDGGSSRVLARRPQHRVREHRERQRRHLRAAVHAARRRRRLRRPRTSRTTRRRLSSGLLAGRRAHRVHDRPRHARVAAIRSSLHAAARRRRLRHGSRRRQRRSG